MTLGALLIWILAAGSFQNSSQQSPPLDCGLKPVTQFKWTEYNKGDRMLLQSLSHRETVISLSGLLSPWLTLRTAMQWAALQRCLWELMLPLKHHEGTSLQQCLRTYCANGHTSGFGSETSWSKAWGKATV